MENKNATITDIETLKKTFQTIDLQSLMAALRSNELPDAYISLMFMLYMNQLVTRMEVQHLHSNRESIHGIRWTLFDSFPEWIWLLTHGKHCLDTTEF